jgi:20S proteasome subunit alpha 3
MLYLYQLHFTLITCIIYQHPQTSEKTYKLCPHATCTVAGLTADANILIDQARLRAGRYAYQYQEPIPIENLVEHVCNYKQAYTQYGGLRPFGVAFLFAGYDETHGFQLYQSDPSGNYSGWKATVIGANNQAGKSLLKTEYGVKKETDGDEMKTDDPTGGEEIELPDLAEACRLAVKVLNKTMDGAVASPEKLELFTMSLDEEGNCVHKILNAKESGEIIAQVEAETQSAGDT